ncbi:MAG: undecaprenyldiphospho-muramoylpentapeptide beta-N-acetylglucosaminyltransferase [Acidobacteria bacterium]|nr:MAG: undecaprenyldiphospho-muramoylpentapeptide beta-N-acetylglucosaminyltransferase [Acidobacteriota bacterium]
MKVIIAGGGTGGHLFPGIAVAREIQRRDPGSTILFVGAEQGIEARIVPKEGYELRTLPIGGIKGVGVGRQVRNLMGMVSGGLKAQKILRQFNPDVVIGVGGYASFPMLSAAILGGYPRIVMEQNAIPGLANRVLGKWVDFAAVTDARTQSYFGQRSVVTGNPIRPEFKSIPPKVHVPPYTILIFGGSQGAQSINRAVIDALENLDNWKDRLRFVHQTGERQLEDVRRAYVTKGFQADVRVFFNNFHEQYAAADLIVSRSGATTVAEIKAAGRAAVLIPFPFATDDHQTKNARAMADENAAVLISNADLTGKRLAESVRELIGNPARLLEIETNARRMAILDAEERIVNLVELAVERRAAP